MIKSFTIVTAIFLLGNKGICQKKSIWLGAGFSTDIPVDTRHVEQQIISLDFKYQITDKIFLNITYDRVYNSDKLRTIELDNGTQFWEETDAIGIGAGVFLKKDKLIITASSGLMIDIIHVYQYVILPSDYYFFDNSITGFGVPIKVQIAITSKWMGIGLIGQYKFSTKFDYYGVGLNLMFGQLR